MGVSNSCKPHLVRIEGVQGRVRLLNRRKARGPNGTPRFHDEMGFRSRALVDIWHPKPARACEPVAAASRGPLSQTYKADI